MPTRPGREAILDAALALAESRHWETVRLHEVAARLDIGLDDIHRHFAEKEDLVDAWFDRADRAMLAQSRGADFLALAFPDNFEACVMGWLGALAQHRRTTREMIMVRLEPGHLHIQIPTLLRISRTVQWMREACRREQSFLARATEETALSSLFIATVASWLTDESENFERTRQRLRRGLATIERLRRSLP
jgi:ubiquinone biosynthesis protein COQ9